MVDRKQAFMLYDPEENASMADSNKDKMQKSTTEGNGIIMAIIVTILEQGAQETLILNTG